MPRSVSVQVRDGSIFMSAVIDAKAFARLKACIDYAKTGADGAKIVYGGTYDDSKGYFVEPTLIQVANPESKLLEDVSCAKILARLSLLSRSSSDRSLPHTPTRMPTRRKRCVA